MIMIPGAWEPGRLSGAVVDGKVLIVDDEAANVAVLSRMMRNLGYATVVGRRRRSRARRGRP